MLTLARQMIFVAAVLLLSSVTCGQVVVHEIPSPTANATGLCWDGSSLWVSDYSSSIRRVNPETGAVTRTLTGPVNGSRGLAFENGYLWTISRVASDLHVYRVDTTSGAVSDQIIDPTGGWSGGLTWDGSALWFSDYYPNDRFLRFDPVTEDTLALFDAPGQQPYGMAWDGVALWNSSEDADGSDRIYRIDPTNGATLWSFALPPHSSGQHRRPRGLAWDGQYLWVIAYNQTTFDVKIYQYDVSNAVNPDIDFSDFSHDFGSHVVGYPPTWTTNATNIGNSLLRIDSARFAVGTAFNLLVPTTFPVTITTGAVQPFDIQFDPPAAVQYRDTLVVYSNDPDENPVRIALAGMGLADEGDIAVDPTSIFFGQVRIRNPLLSTSRELNILNLGSGTLTVSGYEFVGDDAFRTDPLNFPVQIDSQGVFTTRVWFDPTEVRTYGGSLLIYSDDPDEPVIQVALDGSGQDYQFEGGQVLWYFEATGDSYDNSINSVQALDDVDGDGITDVIAASGNHLIYCLNGSSTDWADTLWTYNTGSNPNHSGIVYYERGMSRCPDLNGDGIDEVIIGTSGGSRSVYALSGADGSEMWMFDTHIWGEGGWVYEVYPIEDINNDFVPDVLGCAGDDGSGTGPRRVFAVSGASGQLLWDTTPLSAFFSVRTIRDVTGDGVDDVVAGDTDGHVFGYSGVSGAQVWSAGVGVGSPVFALLAMGNANPEQNQTEDVVVASAYSGVYCFDGGNGGRIWLSSSGSYVYELAVGGDVTGDGVNEVYYATVAGFVVCVNGASGELIWGVPADPGSPHNVLSLTSIPDVTGDDIPDIVAGTLGFNVVLLSGFNGERFWYTIGEGPASAVDALAVLPDIDGNDSWEIVGGHRSGVVNVLSGGLLVNDVGKEPELTATDFSLGLAYPNPFNSVTTIPYVVGRDGRVTMAVFDILGRQVATLVNSVQPAGKYQIQWNGNGVSGLAAGSGLYFVRLNANSFSATQKISLIK